MYTQKLFNIRKLNESGRSMVEILGVLAVIGVLSIGSIVGYQYAMNKHRANELISDVTVAAITAADQARALAENLTVGNRDNYKTQYALTAYYENEVEDVFVISAANVDTDVCRDVIQMEWKLPLDLYVTADGNAQKDSGDVAICGVNNGNVLMEWIFNTDLGSEETITDNPDRCVGTMIDGKCCPEGARIKDGVCCGINKCCAGEFKDRNGDCYECDAAKIVPSTRANCSTCGNREYTQLGNCILPEMCDGFTYNNKCYPCDYSDGVSVSETECVKCSEREMVSGKCVLKECEGVLYSGKCYSCDYNSALTVTSKEGCIKNCPDRFYNEGKCYPSCDGIWTSASQCYSCNYGDRISVSGTMCTEKCPNRGTDGFYCYPSKCDGVWDDANKCHSCDDPESFLVASDACSQKCPNRTLETGHTSLCSLTSNCSNGFKGAGSLGCYACDVSEAVYIAFGGTCGNCTNRENINDFCVLKECNGFKDTYGNCYACNEPKGIIASTCGSCTNREMVSNTYCALKECTGFRDYSGGCFPCDDSRRISVGSNGTCGNCKNRENIDGYCVPSCNGFWYDDVCHQCNDTGVFDEEECDKCPNRRYISDSCYSESGFNNRQGVHYSCDETKAISQAPDCSELCSNRQLVGGYCIRDDYFLNTGVISSYPCSYKGSVASTAAYCALCDDTVYPRIFSSLTSTCSLKADDF